MIPELDSMAWEAKRHHHAADPDTSRLSAHAARNLAITHLELVQRALQGRPDGATGEELAAATGLQYHEAVRRLSDLKNRGLIEDSGRRRANTSGRPAIIWTWKRPQFTGRLFD